MLVVKFLCEYLPKTNRIPNPIFLRASLSGKGGEKKDPCPPTFASPPKLKDSEPKPACPPKPCPPSEPSSSAKCTPKPPSCPPPPKSSTKPPSCPPPPPPKCSPKPISCPPSPKCPPKSEPSACPPASPSPSPAINGKVAVITGGSVGIGYYCALAILKNGGKVMLGDVKVEEGKQAICKIVGEFGYDRAAFIKCDVTKVEDMECLFDAALCEFKKIDIVINNAGILQDKYWAKTCDINVKGVICGTLLGFRHMRQNKNGGTIINLSSILGFDSCHGCPVYCGTKHFVKGFSRSMGHDFYYCQTGVKVMTLCPGVTITAMVEDSGENPQLEGFGETSKELHKELYSLPTQPGDVCGLHIVPILEANINGSDWISEDGETYRMKRVDRKTLRIS